MTFRTQSIFIFQPTNLLFMNRITRIFIALTFIVSITTLSCRKEFLPDWWHDKGHVNDKLSNQIILEWSNAAFEAAGGASEGHPLLA